MAKVMLGKVGRFISKSNFMEKKMNVPSPCHLTPCPNNATDADRIRSHQSIIIIFLTNMSVNHYIALLYKSVACVC